MSSTSCTNLLRMFGCAPGNWFHCLAEGGARNDCSSTMACAHSDFIQGPHQHDRHPELKELKGMLERMNPRFTNLQTVRSDKSG
jgi:hypothetical protein